MDTHELCQPRTIASVVVGSQLHGLATEASDTDRVTIGASPLRTMLSPFREHKNKVVIEEGVDHTFYEYQNFIKLTTSGNATILEALYSHIIDSTSSLWRMTIDYRTELLDGVRIYKAHRGYADSQMGHVNNDGIHTFRGRKAACAYLRVLWQGSELLRFGTVEYPMENWVGDMIRELRFGTDTITPNEFKKMAAPVEDLLDRAYAQSKLPTANLQIAEWLIEEAYADV